MFQEYQIATHKQKNYPQQTHQVMQPKLLVETFAYLSDTEETYYILPEQYEHYWMVNQVEHYMLLVKMSIYLRNFEGTHYIPLEQQDYNWVVNHAKYECVQVYDNDYTWIEVCRNALLIEDSPQTGMYAFLWFEMREQRSQQWEMNFVTGRCNKTKQRRE